MRIPLQVKPQGIYCPDGDFFIDAWSPVPICLITHAHGDHAKFGHDLYISTERTKEILNYRLGSDHNYKTYPYEEKIKLKNCWVSLHPAGHILGSSQIRIETKDSICVVSGDYKRDFDSTCEPFSLQKCDIFVTESTFALPIYNWEESKETAKKIYDWWTENASRGFTSVLFCYALGKAQRILALLKEFTDKPVYAHGAILPLAQIYSNSGISLLPIFPVSEKKNFTKDLILAPPLAMGTPWLKKFYPYRSGFASGWMQVRGMRKQRHVDKGFVLSDHADWNDLIQTIQETEASTILTTHGNATVLAEYLQEQNVNAYPLKETEIIEEGEG